MNAFLVALFGSVPFHVLAFIASVVLVRHWLKLAGGAVKPAARMVRPAWLRLQVVMLRASPGLVYLAVDYGGREREPGPVAAPPAVRIEVRRCDGCERGYHQRPKRLVHVAGGRAYYLDDLPSPPLDPPPGG